MLINMLITCPTSKDWFWGKWVNISFTQHFKQISDSEHKERSSTQVSYFVFYPTQIMTENIVTSQMVITVISRSDRIFYYSTD